MVARSSQQGKFIDGIYIDPHHRNNGRPVAHSNAPVKPRTPGKKGAAPNKKPLDTKSLKNKYAGILHVPVSRVSNLALYQFIEKWYGTVYCMGGTDAAGIDCSGLVQRLYGEVYGVDLVRTAMDQYRNCQRINKAANAIEGDLVFFSIGSRNITHVGVYLANNFFVHASSSGGVMISSLEEDYWHKYFAGCGRVPRG